MKGHGEVTLPMIIYFPPGHNQFSLQLQGPDKVQLTLAEGAQLDNLPAGGSLSLLIQVLIDRYWR